jgi:hypothetical protein
VLALDASAAEIRTEVRAIRIEHSGLSGRGTEHDDAPAEAIERHHAA